MTDPRADQMRAMVPIRATSNMSPEDVLRVTQAKFDTALDARYAISNGNPWSVFIHTSRALEAPLFLSAIGQTVNLATTKGPLFTGGAMRSGQGDSAPLQRLLIDRLLGKGQDIWRTLAD